MTIDVQQATGDSLRGAVALATAAHVRAHAAEPLLGATYQDPTAARAVLDRAEDGWVALSGGRVVAALFATPTRFGVSGGPVGLGGDQAALADVYAAAADEWVRDGHLRHGLHIYASDRSSHDALVTLGFGHEQAYALHPLDLLPPQPDVPGLTMRPGAPADLDDVMTLAPLVSDHQAGSPVFAPRNAAYYNGLREQHAGELAAGVRYLLAYLDGQPAGMALTYDGEVSPLVPPDAIEMPFVSVAPNARGRGVGLALTSAVLRDAQARDARCVVTDWRTTNLLSSRFWPARGFRTYALRLTRVIDPTPV